MKFVNVSLKVALQFICILDNQRLIGKETKRDIRIDADTRARIVTVSVNERSPRESKIGLTMRQQGLGRLEWIEEDLSRAEA